MAQVTHDMETRMDREAPVIGFIGLGRMGGPMAARLADAGYRLVVLDTAAEAMAPLLARGAEAAQSPADVAGRSDIVLASLPTPQVVERVALGEDGVHAGGRARIFADLSTTGATVAQRVAAGLAARGIIGADAPVSGGITGAVAGTLAVMLSCPAPERAALEPVLACFGRVFHVGETPGLGQTMKLVNNILSGTSLVATAEAVVMAVKAGLDAETAIDVINAGSGRTSASQDKFPRTMLPRRFDFGMPAGLFLKDISLYLAEAEALGAPREIAQAVVQRWAEAARILGPERDMTEILRVMEDAAGVVVAGRDARGG